jgi:hypothetical protein
LIKNSTIFWPKTGKAQSMRLSEQCAFRTERARPGK